MGNKIFTYEIGREYAARVENLRAYDVVSQDVIHRWTYPMVPDISFGGNTSGLRFERCNVYKAAGLLLTSSVYAITPKSCRLGAMPRYNASFRLKMQYMHRNVLIFELRAFY